MIGHSCSATFFFFFWHKASVVFLYYLKKCLYCSDVRPEFWFQDVAFPDMSVEEYEWFFCCFGFIRRTFFILITIALVLINAK